VLHDESRRSLGHCLSNVVPQILTVLRKMEFFNGHAYFNNYGQVPVSV
jgi:hypothetical protein